MMNQRTKKILSVVLIVSLILFVPTFEMVREYVGYSSYAKNLEAGNARLKVGMDQSEVQAILGPPDSVSEDQGRVVWSWNARHHQGFIFTKLGLGDSKGHYGIVAVFDQAKKLASISQGVN